MARSMAMAKLLFLSLHYLFFSISFFLFLISPSSASGIDHPDPFFSFSLPSFDLKNFDNITSFTPRSNSQSQLDIIGFNGGAHITNSSTISLVPSGLVLYRKPIKFVGPNPGFSTYFSLSLSSQAPINATPAPDFSFFLTLSSLSLPLLDLLHGPPPSVISVTFLPSTPSYSDHSQTRLNKNHLQIRVGGLLVPIRIKSRNVPVFSNGQKLHSWIDYSGTFNRLELRLGTSGTARPESPILSYPVDLSDVLWREEMVVGFTSSSDNATQVLINGSQNYTLFEWSFEARHGVPYLMHSQPLDPSRFSSPPTDQNPSAHIMRRLDHPWALVLALIFAAACGVMVTFFALFVWFSVCAHRPVAPVEYPVHPTEVIYEKIVMVGVKDVPNSNHK